ncbi:zinc finger Y-chromosomal protein 1-like [Neocloeon triangulifer]|uniref:zinc finger Y-chromosomal protein 1-like n=1 Tax=Neocloeon triangulifer TaxID=2078957 RepID=UPI00286FA371|nr:zinc finger Y-chromosomal protein 1-like [Neocloeon triangulifer]
MRLYDHVRWNHSKIAIKCRVRGCGDFFKTKTDLEVHMKTKHSNLEESKKHKCSICNCKFRKKASLAHHEAIVHKISKYKFYCPMCPAILISKISLSQHIKRKHKFRTCPACNLEISAILLNKHFVKVSCLKCQRSFDCSELLKRHKKECRSLHFNCDKCPNTFQYKSALRYHMHQMHTHMEPITKGLHFKDRGFYCTICLRYFSSKYCLKLHIKKIHHKTTSRKFHCAHCQKCYISKASLKRHLTQIHKLVTFNYRCHLCSRIFIFKSEYKCHMQTFHMESYKKMVECTVCKNIVQSYQLPRHMLRIHAMKLPL